MRFMAFLGILCCLAPCMLRAADPAEAPAPHTEADSKAESKDGENKHGEAPHDKGNAEGHAKDGHSSRISDEYIPLQIDAMPKRPKPIIELGEPFKGTGTLAPGFTLPTGAVWQPSLLVFGTARMAVQSNDLGGGRVSEAVARLDLFANLQLSGSERLVLGFRNLDQDGRFTSYVFENERPGGEDGSFDELNAEVGTLFFEGDFGEIFPYLSPRDFKPTDIGFAIGRQPLFFQEGMLINDTIDGIGLTRNSVLPKKTSNFRATLFYGWNNVNRSSPVETGRLFGLFTSTDFRKSTMDIDAAFVQGENNLDDVLTVGLSAVQRIGLTNTSFRFLGSFPSGDDTAADNGYLVLSEVSWTPLGTHDHVYINTFWAGNEFFAAALDPSVGGPLGRAGISFTSVGLGQYGAALSARAIDTAGAAFGYQSFFAHNRQQLIFELAGRLDTEEGLGDQYATTLRYQTAMGRRAVFVLDGFANWLEVIDDYSYGGRLELVVSF